MQTISRTGVTDRSLVALAFLNFFLADARDGLGPFLDGFLATNGWSPMTLGIIATLGGVLGMVATPLFGAWVDASKRKRMLIIIPVVLVTAAALWTLASPGNASVFGRRPSVDGSDAGACRRAAVFASGFQERTLEPPG